MLRIIQIILAVCAAVLMIPFIFTEKAIFLGCTYIAISLSITMLGLIEWNNTNYKKSIFLFIASLFFLAFSSLYFINL